MGHSSRPCIKRGPAVQLRRTIGRHRRLAGVADLESGASGHIARCERFDTDITLYYRVFMKTIRHALAVLELLLVFAAALFMTALFARNIQPAPYQPAESARRIVEWFSASPHLGLAVFLIAMPFAAFVIGCATVVRSWANDGEFRHDMLATFAAVRAHLAKLLIAGATLMAGGILAIVAIHMITD